MSKTLFIGGSLDGQWRNEPDESQTLTVSKRGPLGLPHKHEHSIVMDQEEYQRQYFRDPLGSFTAFVLRESRKSLLRMLMEGYHPGEAVTGKARWTHSNEAAVSGDNPTQLVGLARDGAFFEPVTLIMRRPAK